MSRSSTAIALSGLFLLAACTPVMAQNGRNAPDACPAEARESADIPDQDPERARAATLRAKYTAWPATVPADVAKTPQTGGGGNNDGEEDMPRRLNSKWHSFLPGMFR